MYKKISLVLMVVVLMIPFAFALNSAGINYFVIQYSNISGMGVANYIPYWQNSSYLTWSRFTYNDLNTTAELSNYYAALYQPIGDYALKSYVNGVNNVSLATIQALINLNGNYSAEKSSILTNISNLQSNVTYLNGIDNVLNTSKVSLAYLTTWGGGVNNVSQTTIQNLINANGNYSAEKSSMLTNISNLQANVTYLNAVDNVLNTSKVSLAYLITWSGGINNVSRSLIQDLINANGNWSADKNSYNTTTELNSIFAPIGTGGNVSWNETYSSTLYAPKTATYTNITNLQTSNTTLFNNVSYLNAVDNVLNTSKVSLTYLTTWSGGVNNVSQTTIQTLINANGNYSAEKTSIQQNISALQTSNTTLSNNVSYLNTIDNVLNTSKVSLTYLTTWGGGVNNVSQTTIQNLINANGNYTLEKPSILLNITLINNTFYNQGNVTREPTGFVDRTTSTLSFNPVTRNLTIVGTYDFYINATKYTRTNDSLIIPNTTQLNYIYYIDGTLKQSTTSWGFKSFVQVATIYFNAGQQQGLVADERHGIAMDWNTHEYVHETLGARFAFGMAGTFNDTAFNITAGEWYDNDNEFTPTATGYCNLIYRNSTTLSWLPNQTQYYYKNATNMYYDNAGTLTAVTSNNYMAIWFYVTNDVNTPIYCIIGQRTDTTLGNALNNNVPSSLSFSTLPLPELKALYRVIIRNDATPYESTGTVDYRTVSQVASGNYVATSHGTLSGLTADDHPQYLLRTDSDTYNAGSYSNITSLQSSNTTIWNNLTGKANLIGNNTFVGDNYFIGSIVIYNSSQTAYNTTLSLKDGSGVIKANISAISNTFFNGGNVGIATSNPNYLLEVNGTMRAVNHVGLFEGLNITGVYTNVSNLQTNVSYLNAVDNALNTSKASLSGATFTNKVIINQGTNDYGLEINNNGNQRTLFTNTNVNTTGASAYGSNLFYSGVAQTTVPLFRVWDNSVASTVEDVLIDSRGENASAMSIYSYAKKGHDYWETAGLLIYDAAATWTTPSGMYIYTNSATYTSSAVGASSGGGLITAYIDNAAASGTGVNIYQDGTGVGLKVDGSGTGYSAIFNNGNVGINTTAPTYTLDIIGIAKANNHLGLFEGLNITNLYTNVTALQSSNTSLFANLIQVNNTKMNATNPIVVTNLTMPTLTTGALVCVLGDTTTCMIKQNTTCRVFYSPDGLTAMKIANNGTTC